jgi:2-polyprenyl-3-methyl-5-hydroxy-6-metoxy-1,4-benzoquinol methylase
MNKSEKFWDRVSSNFEKQVTNNNKEHNKTVETVKKYLNINEIVLDYGCATGAIAIDIANNVKAIHGIDISSKMIDIAKRKISERKIDNIYFEHSTIFDERYREESFNTILALNILHLLDDKQNVMQRIIELLKPGGLFISETVCLGEKPFMGFFFILLSKIGIVPFIKSFKISELENLIAENFQIIQIKKISRNLPNYFVVARKV